MIEIRNIFPKYYLKIVHPSWDDTEVTILLWIQFVLLSVLIGALAAEIYSYL